MEPLREEGTWGCGGVALGRGIAAGSGNGEKVKEVKDESEEDEEGEEEEEGMEEEEEEGMEGRATMEPSPNLCGLRWVGLGVGSGLHFQPTVNDTNARNTHAAVQERAQRRRHRGINGCSRPPQAQ